MKTFSVVVTATAMVIGVGGAALAYQSASSGPPTVITSQSALPAHASVSPAGPGFKVRFAPCKPPAKRVGRACVVNVVKTVVLPGSSASSGTSESSASTLTSSASGSDQATATVQPTGDDGSATSQESGDEQSGDDQASGGHIESGGQAGQHEQEPNDD